MIKRIIDISEPAYLHIHNKQLCIDRDGETIAQISVEDLGILILQHPAIVVTQAVINQCQSNNTAIVFCDQKRLPSSIILPLWAGNSLHSKVLKEQVASSKATRKRLWKEVVREKIAQQIVTLEQVNAKTKSLERLKDKVKGGDPDNCEAQAARQYWQLLMGKDFRRDPEAEGINSLLNYGYSIIRAMVARALVGAGLHPTLGIHHKNQYNGLCLADDLMEPLRPWVDEIVVSLLREKDGQDCSINRENKQALLSLVSSKVLFDSQVMPLMNAAHSIAARYKYALTGNVSLNFPARLFE